MFKLLQVLHIGVGHAAYIIRKNQSKVNLR